MVLSRASTTDFPYPPLPSKEDALRILTIQPGDFDDEITATLTPVTFGAKPKYAALSYTWGDPYPDNAALPAAPVRKDPTEDSTEESTGIHTPESSSQASDSTVIDEADSILVNNLYFPVKHNLALALRHLRSPKYPLALWVDAICINQKNTDELNTHVAMMSFIYRRAFTVVAWLGVGDFRGYGDAFRYMRREWMSGETQYLAGYLGGSEKMPSSPEAEGPAFTRIATSSYWTRLWIVQEVCLSNQLAFAYGSKIWTCENFCGWNPVAKAICRDGRGLENLSRLFQTRSDRYGEKMSLMSLVEKFSTAASSDIRDKIYGLLGLANDVTPYSRTDDGDVDPADQPIKFLDPHHEPTPKPLGEKGMLKVDYSQSVYDVWAEVLKYVYFGAEMVGGEHTRHVLGTVDRAWIKPKLIEHERHIHIVRASGMVQEALGQKAIHRNTFIRALGYVYGEVLKIGPDYTAIVSSSRSEQEWRSSFESYYTKSWELATLRGDHEKYLRKIIGYEDEELSKIQEISNSNVIAWGFSEKKPLHSDPSYVAKHENIRGEGHEGRQNHSTKQICLFTERQIGIVPSNTKPGDVLVRFVDCSAAIIMRPHIDNKQTSLTLVGRADIYSRASGCSELAGHYIQLGDLSSRYEAGFRSNGTVYVDFDLDTLQLITASITID
ncbi:heterokaryon incompatibility protein-domain-containing protein [Hypoxylon rubiginosum]|uniref:Heterokaryon incompatibility protein-domain-containing protein n=1 Tax=Hypoxylon rubiginosum TaxID=110542 RepID=A0ACC0CJK7_9PEZI|nr:heterokaryon incompatibility protein-domain-containing protein [Hypoxylon rubiginosum]